MESKKQQLLEYVTKLELRLEEVRRTIAGLGDMSSLLRRIKSSIKELNEVPDANNKQVLSPKQIADIVKDMMGLPNYLPIDSMAPSMKNTFELGVQCIEKGIKISQLPPLNYGDFCTAKCTAPARYIGFGKCLYISAMTNELTVDDVDLFGARENTFTLPIASDDDFNKHAYEYFNGNKK